MIPSNNLVAPGGSQANLHESQPGAILSVSGWSSLVARVAHNHEVASSNLASDPSFPAPVRRINHNPRECLLGVFRSPSSSLNFDRSHGGIRGLAPIPLGKLVHLLR